MCLFQVFAPPGEFWCWSFKTFCYVFLGGCLFNWSFNLLFRVFLRCTKFLGNKNGMVFKVIQPGGITIFVLLACCLGDSIWVAAQEISLPFNRDLCCKVANLQVQNTFLVPIIQPKTSQDSINCCFSPSQLPWNTPSSPRVGVEIPQLLAKHDVGQNCSGHHPQGQPGVNDDGEHLCSCQAMWRKKIAQRKRCFSLERKCYIYIYYILILGFHPPNK